MEFCIDEDIIGVFLHFKPMTSRK